MTAAHLTDVTHIAPREKAEILAQALPYIRKYHGKTLVIKYGGNASMPCHGKSTGTTDDSPAPQTCAMCDVCHSVFAGLPSAQAVLPALPPAVPCAAVVAPVQPAVLSGPERPPRIILA